MLEIRDMNASVPLFEPKSFENTVSDIVNLFSPALARVAGFPIRIRQDLDGELSEAPSGFDTKSPELATRACARIFGLSAGEGTRFRGFFGNPGRRASSGRLPPKKHKKWRMLKENAKSGKLYVSVCF